jgi:hypothetical protein
MVVLASNKAMSVDTAIVAKAKAASRLMRSDCEAVHLGKSRQLTARKDYVVIELMLAVCYEADV